MKVAESAATDPSRTTLPSTAFEIFMFILLDPRPSCFGVRTDLPSYGQLRGHTVKNRLSTVERPFDQIREPCAQERRTGRRTIRVLRCLAWCTSSEAATLVRSQGRLVE